MEYELRPHQRAAVSAIFRYFESGNKGNPLVCAPTGSGKSHILGGFVQQANKRFPSEKILILTHNKEIIQQDAKVLSGYVPKELVGIYSAGLNSKQIAQYTIASIQSAHKKAHLFKDCSLVAVDEAHLIPPSGDGYYRAFLHALGDKRVVGFTATPFRRGHGMLTEGHIFDKIVYDIPIQLLINQGHLVPLSTKETDYEMDVSGIKKLAGDFSKKDLSANLDNYSVIDEITTALTRFKGAHKSWLIFAIDIENCEHIAESLNSKGISAAAVHSKLGYDRTHLLDLFKAEKVQALVSVEALTTGFDAPNIDLLVMARPTCSPVLYVQMLGRGMRTYPGKDKCLVLDFAANVSRLGPVDGIHLAVQRKGKGGNAPTKTCPKCSEIVNINIKICPDCGHEFQMATKLTAEFDDGAVLKSQVKPVYKTFDVQKMRLSRHSKVGKPPSLVVSYYRDKFTAFREWVCFEHEGWPRQKAEKWWAISTNGTRPPKTVDEAINRRGEVMRPKQIDVLLSHKYPEITKRIFNAEPKNDH